MNEEEKKAVEGLKDYVARIKKFHFEQTQGFKWVDITLNLLDNQQKELNSLKEIEQQHQEENGNLRVELEQKEQIIKRLEQDVEGYRDLSKQIQEDYSKQIQEDYSKQ